MILSFVELNDTYHPYFSILTQERNVCQLYGNYIRFIPSPLPCWQRGFSIEKNRRSGACPNRRSEIGMVGTLKR